MITRDIGRMVEDLFRPDGSKGLQRLEKVMQGTLLILQGLVSSLSIPTDLWVAGTGDKILGADIDGTPEGSIYSTKWWLLMQSSVAVFTTMFTLPLSTLMSLAVTDENGDLVLDENDNPIRPFVVFDPNPLPVEWLGWNLRRIVYADPVMATTPEEEPEIEEV